MAGMVGGGFILRAECTSRMIKFDSKQTKTTGRLEAVTKYIKSIQSPSEATAPPSYNQLIGYAGDAVLDPACAERSGDGLEVHDSQQRSKAGKRSKQADSGVGSGEK
jgi:hypothetical protein